MESQSALPPFPVWPKTLADVLALRWVDDAERANLPDDRGLYFALIDRERIAYIGVAWSFRKRWKRHEKLGQLRALGALSVAILPCPRRPMVWQAELAAIWHFEPALNAQIKYRDRRRFWPQLWPTPEWDADHPGWVSASRA